MMTEEYVEWNQYRNYQFAKYWRKVRNDIKPLLEWHKELESRRDEFHNNKIQKSSKPKIGE